MSKPKNEAGRAVVPTELPMPAYKYQKQASGSFAVKYDGEKERKEGERAACLEHVRFAG